MRNTLTWKVGIEGHMVETVTIDRSQSGKMITDCAWATCECTEPFMGETIDNLVERILTHFFVIRFPDGLA